MLADIYTLLKLASPVVGPPAQHRCSGCGLRWEDGTTVELCGDCWRKGQAVIHADVPPPAPETREEPRDELAHDYTPEQMAALRAEFDAFCQRRDERQNAVARVATLEATWEAEHATVMRLGAERDALRHALSDALDIWEYIDARQARKRFRKLLALPPREDPT